MALSDKQISKMWSDAHNDTSDRMEAAKLHQYKPQAVAFQEATIDAAKRAITEARARLGEKT